MAAVARPVEPTADDLDGAKADEVRVFEVRGIKERVSKLRTGLFAELGTILDTERNDLFVRSLGHWMPINDEDRGVSTGMAVYAMDHRIRFRPILGEDTGEPTLFWGIADPGRFSVNGLIQVRDIPPPFRPYIQDWLKATSRPSTKPEVPVPSGE